MPFLAADKHVKLTKPGGKVVVVAPNLEGVQGRIFAKLAPALWEAHTRAWSPAFFAAGTKPGAC